MGVKPRFPEMCTAALPKEIDWTTKGAVTGVKDQGECGNCFTFGGTCDMEAAWFLAGNPLVSLSEQQLTSCDKIGGDAGCYGGDTNLDTDEYVTAHGLNSEKNYPYSKATKQKQKNGKCDKALEAQPVAKFTNGYQISGGVGKQPVYGYHCDWCSKQPVDENQMMKHLATAGPFTIAINSKYFDNYKKGIMNPPSCSGNLTKLDHQVAIVGYGSENGNDYWKIKNSWGTDWGENGFCRIARGTNKCGVAADASHVVAAGADPGPSPPSPTPPSPPSPTPPPSPPTPPSPPSTGPSPEPTPTGKCTQKCMDTVFKLCPSSQYSSYNKCINCGFSKQVVQNHCTQNQGKACCSDLHPSAVVVDAQAIPCRSATECTWILTETECRKQCACHCVHSVVEAACVSSALVSLWLTPSTS